MGWKDAPLTKNTSSGSWRDAPISVAAPPPALITPAPPIAGQVDANTQPNDVAQPPF